MYHQPSTVRRGLVASFLIPGPYFSIEEAA